MNFVDMSYLNRILPMQKNSTILWVFQDFEDAKTDDLILVDELFDSQKELTILFAELEKKMPEMSDDILNRILERI
jgi:hypothetical protein